MGNKNLMEQIKELEESHLNLDVRKSSEELDKILADDFFEIGSSGRMIYKEECITSGVDIDELELYEFELHPLGSDVVLTTYFIHNKTKNRNTLRSSIWRYQEERWRLYFHQGTVTDRPIPN